MSLIVAFKYLVGCIAKTMVLRLSSLATTISSIQITSGRQSYRTRRSAREDKSKSRPRATLGATKKKRRNLNFKANFSKVKPFLGLLCIAGVISALVIKVDFRSYLGRIETMTSRPISSVVVRGEFKFISKSKVRKAVRANLQQDFVHLDLLNLKTTLEMNPWVENVELTRVWPAKLVINIQEQVPIARWGEHGFINRYGKKINVENNSILNNLPRLLGPDNMERKIASEYLKMSRLLAEKNIQLDGVSVNESTSWVLNLPQQRLFYLGADNLADKLDLFLQIYEQHLAGSLENVKKIDMRYQSGLAIEWIDGEHQKNASQKLRMQNYASN